MASNTKSHAHVSNLNQEQFRAELEYIEQKCQELQIQKPETFAYPGYSTHPDAFQIHQAKGYQFARAGDSRPYDPEKDHSYLLPSYSTTGTDKQRVLDAFAQAKDGKVVIFTVHGVPDTAHDWVTTPPALFKEYLKYLHNNKYQVIALRDLKKYVNVAKSLTEIKPVFTNLTNSP